MKMLFDYKINKRLIRTGLGVLTVFTCSVFADKIHDPTRPKGFELTTSTITAKNSATNNNSLTLQGVVNRKTDKVAIIGGQLVELGAFVSGYKLIQINNNSVVLTRSGKQKRLYVYE